MTNNNIITEGAKLHETKETRTSDFLSCFINTQYLIARRTGANRTASSAR